MKFLINLHKVHKESGKTPYRVAMDTGLSQTTVRKYVNEKNILMDYLPNTVMVLIDYYEADWHNPEILRLLKDDESPEIKRPELLACTA